MTARSAEVRRTRLAIGLTMVGAVLLMSGVLMTLVGEVTRLNSARKWHVLIGNGEIMAAAGLACGLAAMVAVAVGAAGRPAGLRVRQVGIVTDLNRVPDLGPAAELGLVSDLGPALMLSPASDGASDGWVHASDGRRHAAHRGHGDGRGNAGYRDHVDARESDGQRERASQDERASQRREHEVAAEEWLSQFRPAHAAYVPEPESWPAQEPESWPRQERIRAGGSGLEPSELSDSRAADDWAADDRAADDTVPLPVITPAIPPAPASPACASPALVPPAPFSPVLSHLAPPDPVPAAARAKLDQIKDLYVTAEAIGEDALGKHFDELSERQRQLIREYFNQAGVGPGTVAGMTSDRARNSAALPG